MNVVLCSLTRRLAIFICIVLSGLTQTIIAQEYDATFEYSDGCECDLDKKQDILDYFTERDFTFLPFIRIVEELGFDSDGTGDKKSVSSCSVEDNANMIIEHYAGEFAGQPFHFGEFLEGSCDRDDVEYLLTGDSYFCDDIESINQHWQDFQSETEKLIVWVHLFKTDYDIESPDLLLIKHNEEQLRENSEDGDHDINVREWDDFNTAPSNIDKNFEYKVFQRCFAPWIDFGHWPLGFDQFLTKNNFQADSRWYSRNGHSSNSNLGPTARCYQENFFQLNVDNNGNPGSKLSSGTVGVLNMCPEWAPSSIPGPAGQFIDLPCDGTPACDWDNSTMCRRTATVNGAEWMNGGYSYMHYWATNSCVQFSTAIDSRVKLRYDVIVESGHHYLEVYGVILNKGFPSNELVIEDGIGNSVYLYTDRPANEQSLVWPGLLPPTYDNVALFKYLIEIDENSGAFLDQIRVGVSSNSAQLSPVLVLPSLPHSDEIFWTVSQNPTWDFRDVSIEIWNLERESMSAALEDCPELPCCGILDCCE